MSCDRKGNRRSGVAFADLSGLYTYGDEQLTKTSYVAWYCLPLRVFGAPLGVTLLEFYHDLWQLVSEK